MTVDIDKFTKHLYDAANKRMHSQRRCGEFVRKALQAGGANFHGRYPATGKEFGPALEMLGFHQITVDNPDKFPFVKGDVRVMEPHSRSTAGHVAGYDGKEWVSDFVQRDFWAGKEYRKERPHYAVYRYSPVDCNGPAGGQRKRSRIEQQAAAPVFVRSGTRTAFAARPAQARQIP